MTSWVANLCFFNWQFLCRTSWKDGSFSKTSNARIFGFLFEVLIRNPQEFLYAQVLNWFQNRRYALRAKAARSAVPGQVNMAPVPNQAVVNTVAQAPQLQTAASGNTKSVSSWESRTISFFEFVLCYKDMLSYLFYIFIFDLAIFSCSCPAPASVRSVPQVVQSVPAPPGKLLALSLHLFMCFMLTF